MQFFGIFHYSVELKKIPTKYKNENISHFKFRKSSFLRYWSIFISCFVIIFKFYDRFINFKDLFIENSKYDVHGIANFIFETYLIFINIFIYFHFYKKSVLFKSIFKFLISLYDNKTNIYYLILIYYLPLIIISLLSLSILYIKRFIFKEFIDIMYLINDFISYNIPFFLYYCIIGIFIQAVVSLSTIFDIKSNNFEKIFNEKTCTSKCLRFNNKNFEKIFSNCLNLDFVKIKSTLSTFSAKLQILNQNQKKLNNFLGIIMTCILSETIFLLIFCPFYFTYELKFLSILNNIIYLAAPLTRLITCCVVPEAVLTKVS